MSSHEPATPRGRRQLIVWNVAALVVVALIAGGYLVGYRARGEASAHRPAVTSTVTPCVNSGYFCPVDDPTDHDPADLGTPGDDATEDAPAIPTPSAIDESPPLANVGEPATLRLDTPLKSERTVAEVTVNSIHNYHHAYNDAGQLFDPENGRYVVADVTIRCVEGSLVYGALDFTVETTSGQSYGWLDGNSSYANYPPKLGTAQLAADEVAHGMVSLDASMETGSTLVFGYFGNQVGWSVPDE